jgi:CubicO group peptidase (beta-lactamase class C family)
MTRRAVSSSLGLAALGSAFLALAVALAPRPVLLAGTSTGDQELARQLRQMLGDRPGTRALAVALIEPTATRIAGLGKSGDPRDPAVTLHTAFEIGSVTKGLNGMLLATLAADGLVAIDQRVGEIIARPAFHDSPVADVTLLELAQHRAGLPRVGMAGPLTLLRSGYTAFAGADPYPPWTSDELLDHAARLSVRRRGSFAYSNIGAALLGHAMAQAAGRTYPALLEDRIFRPLGLDSTSVATSPSALPDRRVRGTSYTGRPRAPWTGEGNAPAGTVWSSAHDMARVVRGLTDGSAPGAAATIPSEAIAGGTRIGLGWFTSHVEGHDVTWHSGATGGFSSWAGFDRATQRGVVVLSASDRRVDALALHLLGLAPPPRQPGWSMPDRVGLVMLALVVFTPIGVCLSLRPTYPDRLAPARVVANATLGLALLWVLGPWLDAPWLIWTTAAAVTATASVALLWKTRHVPWPRGGLRYVLFTLRVVACAAVIIAIV